MTRFARTQLSGGCRVPCIRGVLVAGPGFRRARTPQGGGGAALGEGPIRAEINPQPARGIAARMAYKLAHKAPARTRPTT